jgi:hypothetical protein
MDRWVKRDRLPQCTQAPSEPPSTAGWSGLVRGKLLEPAGTDGEPSRVGNLLPTGSVCLAADAAIPTLRVV